MSDGPYKPVVEQLAETVSGRVATKVVTYLRKQTNARLSGDDSGLKNSWEEFCVQVQEEESFAWDAFVDTIKQTIRGHLDDLKQHEKQAVWLCSDEGLDWALDHGDHDEKLSLPISEEDIVELIFERVVTLANLYSNARIRRYLDGEYAD